MHFLVECYRDSFSISCVSHFKISWVDKDMADNQILEYGSTENGNVLGYKVRF